jgi:hypothetical protein
MTQEPRRGRVTEIPEDVFRGLRTDHVPNVSVWPALLRALSLLPLIFILLSDPSLLKGMGWALPVLIIFGAFVGFFGATGATVIAAGMIYLGGLLLVSQGSRGGDAAVIYTLLLYPMLLGLFFVGHSLASVFRQVVLRR